MFVRVHHIDGVIVQIDDCLHDSLLGREVVSHVPGADIAVADLDRVPTEFDRFDIATNGLRSLTLAEFQAAGVEAIRNELLALVGRELSATDWRDALDLDDAGRAFRKYPEWVTYREQVRELVNIDHALDMLAAWPLRPDGTDAAASLKSG